MTLFANYSDDEDHDALEKCIICKMKVEEPCARNTVYGAFIAMCYGTVIYEECVNDLPGGSKDIKKKFN